MRRDIGLVLAGLGIFLIVLAVALPTYISGRVLKFPLNFYYEATLDSPNTTYFNAAKVQPVNGADVHAVYTFKGDASAGNSSTAVWKLFTYVYDTSLPSGPEQEIQIQSRTFAFDRKTAQLKDCCGQSPANQSGVAGYTFPMNTQQKTYDVYDATLGRAMPFAYAGTDTVDGILTYKFTENVTPTKIGFSPLSATDPEFYATSVTYWVDPDTGVLLKVNQHQQQFLENAITSQRTTTLFDGTFTSTPASVSVIVGIDNSGRLKVTLLKTVLPIAGGVLGAALLVWGVLLARKRPGLADSGVEAITRPLGAAPSSPDESAPSQSTGGKHAARPGGMTGIVPGLDSAPRTTTPNNPTEPDNPDDQPR